MKPESSGAAADDMRAEYDIRGGERGKYYERFQQGTNLVLLEPDVAAIFHTSESVNRALRVLIEAGREQVNTSKQDERPKAPSQY